MLRDNNQAIRAARLRNHRPPDPKDNGPFGFHPNVGRERLLNLAVCQEKIPFEDADIFNIDNRFIYLHGVEVGVYRWIGRDFIVRWQGDLSQYNEQRFAILATGMKKPDFRLTLSMRDMACFMIRGKDATPALRDFIKYSMFGNHRGMEGYQHSIASGASFQEGTDQHNSDSILVEFATSRYDLSKAWAWIDYLNRNYRPA